MAKFTVFGSEGFIGRKLTEHLVALGHELLAPKKGEQLRVDQNLGHVVYCVGVTGSDFLTQQFNVARAHVSLAAEVLEKYKFESFLYLSSARMYEGLDSTHEEAVFRANTESISDFYNLSKLFGESLVLNCGLPHVRVVRVSYAVNLDPASTNFIAEQYREAQTGVVTFSTNRKSAKDYVVLDDVVGILPKIALNGKFRVYNVASGKNIFTDEIAKTLEEMTGCKVVFLDTDPVRSPRAIDISRIQNEFGYRPQSVLDYAKTVIASGYVQ